MCFNKETSKGKRFKEVPGKAQDKRGDSVVGTRGRGLVVSLYLYVEPNGNDGLLFCRCTYNAESNQQQMMFMSAFNSR